MCKQSSRSTCKQSGLDRLCPPAERTSEMRKSPANSRLPKGEQSRSPLRASRGECENLGDGAYIWLGLPLWNGGSPFALIKGTKSLQINCRTTFFFRLLVIQCTVLLLCPARNGDGIQTKEERHARIAFSRWLDGGAARCRTERSERGLSWI